MDSTMSATPIYPPSTGALTELLPQLVAIRPPIPRFPLPPCRPKLGLLRRQRVLQLDQAPQRLPRLLRQPPHRRSRVRGSLLQQGDRRRPGEAIGPRQDALEEDTDAKRPLVQVLLSLDRPALRVPPNASSACGEARSGIRRSRFARRRRACVTGHGGVFVTVRRCSGRLFACLEGAFAYAALTNLCARNTCRLCHRTFSCSFRTLSLSASAIPPWP